MNAHRYQFISVCFVNPSHIVYVKQYRLVVVVLLINFMQVLSGLSGISYYHILFLRNEIGNFIMDVLNSLFQTNDYFS